MYSKRIVEQQSLQISMFTLTFILPEETDANVVKPRTTEEVVETGP